MVLTAKFNRHSVENDLYYSLKAINSSLNKWIKITLWAHNLSISPCLASLDSLPGWASIFDVFNLVLITNLESCHLNFLFCQFALPPTSRGKFLLSLLLASIPCLLKKDTGPHWLCPLQLMCYTISISCWFSWPLPIMAGPNVFENPQSSSSSDNNNNNNINSNNNKNNNNSKYYYSTYSISGYSISV